MESKTKLTIQRILKVNHAGEYGAIRIYRAQLFIAKICHAELVPFLERTLSHEIDHCKNFYQAMPAYNARPCRMMWLWGLGGYLLGLITALMGKNSIMICTASVEKTVHAHLNDQIRFLHGIDDKIKDLICAIQVEEVEHLEFAERSLRPSLIQKPLYFFIARSTDIVIWLSTQGDVNKMKEAILKKQ